MGYVYKQVVDATPMSRAAYNVHRGWTLPADEDGTDAGYMLVAEGTGHKTWVPYYVFATNCDPA